MLRAIVRHCFSPGCHSTIVRAPTHGQQRKWCKRTKNGIEEKLITFSLEMLATLYARWFSDAAIDSSMAWAEERSPWDRDSQLHNAPKANIAARKMQTSTSSEHKKEKQFTFVCCFLPRLVLSLFFIFLRFIFLFSPVAARTNRSSFQWEWTIKR